MSHTDKDAPYWATAPWVPEHTIACNAGRVPCTLAPTPPRRHEQRPRFSRNIAGWRAWYESCRWECVDHRTYVQACGGVPKWFRDHRWNNPQRVLVRDQGRRAVAEHRATGTVDVIHNTDQHHHRAEWEFY